MTPPITNYPPMGPEAVLTHQRRRAARMALLRRFGYDSDAAVRFVVSQVCPVHNGPVLEIGTGKGHFLVALAQRGLRVVSVDISAEQQHHARLAAAYARVLDRIEFRIADAQALPWPAGRFRAVVSMNTFHHLPCPDQALIEMRRVLAPGGQLVVADFSATGLQRMAAIHRSEGRRHSTPPNRFAHWQAWLRTHGCRVKWIQGNEQEVLVARANGTGNQLGSAAPRTRRFL